MRTLALILLAALAAGCAAPPVPPERFFRLRVEAAVAPAPAAIPGTLVVQAPRVDGIHNERAIIYSDDPGHRELKQYHYRHWVTPPAQLVQDYLVAYLRQAGSAARVQRDFGDGFTDHVVSGHLTGFEQLVDGERLTAAVDLELAVTAPGAEQAALRRRYTEKAAVDGGDMAATVRAFEQALHAIAADFAADLAELAAGHETARR